jgi:hypothetical protein
METTETTPSREWHYFVTFKCKAEALPRVLEFMWETEKNTQTSFQVREGPAPNFWAGISRF